MESYHGIVITPTDAIILTEAARQNIIPKITRRLSDLERASNIKNGAVFVWDNQNTSMKRWTDGKLWSASRVNGSFLIYKELESNKHSRSYVKRNGLIKQTFSLTLNDGVKLHLINYIRADYLKKYSESIKSISSGSSEQALRRPTDDPFFNNFKLDTGLYPQGILDENYSRSGRSKHTSTTFILDPIPIPNPVTQLPISAIIHFDSPMTLENNNLGCHPSTKRRLRQFDEIESETNKKSKLHHLPDNGPGMAGSITFQEPKKRQLGQNRTDDLSKARPQETTPHTLRLPPIAIPSPLYSSMDQRLSSLPSIRQLQDSHYQSKEYTRMQFNCDYSYTATPGSTASTTYNSTHYSPVNFNHPTFPPRGLSGSPQTPSSSRSSPHSIRILPPLSYYGPSHGSTSKIAPLLRP